MYSLFIVAILAQMPSASPTYATTLNASANAARAKHGLPPFTEDAALNELCQNWANYMARTGRFHHGGGENIIAMGQSSCQSAMNAWLSSPGHRAHVLGGGRLAGWGHAVSSSGYHYWAGVFRGSSGGGSSVAYSSGGSNYRRGFFRIRRR